MTIMNKMSKINKPRKWSMKYKKSINCNMPKGFSQKQYCKYGRSKKSQTRKTNKNQSVKIKYLIMKYFTLLP